VWLQKCENDEERDKYNRLLGGALTPVQRTNRAANDDEQEITIPFLTLLGIHLGGDPSQALFLRGLGERVRFEIDMESGVHWLEGDDGYVITGGATHAEGAAAPLLVNQAHLLCEYEHLYDEERMQQENIYKQYRRYLCKLLPPLYFPPRLLSPCLP